jgi:hypothetical protein
MFHTYRPTARHERFVSLCMELVTDKFSSDAESDSGSHTEYVESLTLNFFS